MIHPDADSRMMLLADVEEGHKALLYLLQLLRILLVGIFFLYKLTCRIHVVAGIHSYFLRIACSHISHMRIKVYIGHQRCLVALRPQPGIDILQILRLLGALRRQPYQFATRIYDSLGLLHTPLSVVGIGGSHRLYAYGMVSPHVYSTYMHDRGGASTVVEQVNCTYTHSP